MISLLFRFPAVPGFHGCLMGFPAVRAGFRETGKRIGKREILPAFPAFPFDLPRRARPLFFFPFPDRLLLAALAEIGNKAKGRIIGKHLPAFLASLFRPGGRILRPGFCRFLRGRFPEQVLHFLRQTHTFPSEGCFALPDSMYYRGGKKARQPKYFRQGCKTAGNAI